MTPGCGLGASGRHVRWGSRRCDPPKLPPGNKEGTRTRSNDKRRRDLDLDESGDERRRPARRPARSPSAARAPGPGPPARAPTHVRRAHADVLEQRAGDDRPDDPGQPATRTAASPATDPAASPARPATADDSVGRQQALADDEQDAARARASIQPPSTARSTSPTAFATRPQPHRARLAERDRSPARSRPPCTATSPRPITVNTAPVAASWNPKRSLAEQRERGLEPAERDHRRRTPRR